MVEFVGFTAEKLRVVQKAHLEAMKCLMMAAQAPSGDKNYSGHFVGPNEFEIAAKKYFGINNGNYTKVNNVVQSMWLAARKNTYKIYAGGKGDGSTIGEARVYGARSGTNMIDTGSENKVYIGEIFEKSGQQKKILNDKSSNINVAHVIDLDFRITIFDPFFDLPVREMDSQNQVDTILHELSHHAAHTEDSTCLGIELYGWYGVKMAILNGTAQDNAENYGFFLASFGHWN